MRFKVTNTSQLSDAGKRNVFLTEAGKLIKPGEHCVCNRLDNGTKRMAEAKVLKVEEGKFAAAPVFKKPPVAEPLPPTPNTSLDMERAAADARAMDDRMKEAEATAKREADEAAAAEVQAKADAEAKVAEEAAAAEADVDSPPETEMSKAEKKAAAKKAKADAKRGNS